MSDEEKFVPPRLRTDDEATTRRRIAVGTLIEVRSSHSSWPAAVAIDVEATPVVGTPTLLRLSQDFARATVGWRVDGDGETTRRWIPQTNASPPPPLVEYVAPFAGLLPPARPNRRAPRIPAIAVGSALLFFLFATVHSQGGKHSPAPAVAAHSAPVSAPAPDRAVADPSPPHDPVTSAAPPAAPVLARPETIAIAARVQAPRKPAPTPPDLLTAAGDAFARGQLDRARAYYAATLVRSPRDVEAISGLGDVARARGAMTQALASYTHALEIDPGFRPAWIGRAEALRALAASPPATPRP